MKKTEANKSPLPAPIIPGTIYTLSGFKQATGMTGSALISARKNGLPIHYVGKRGFILADDFLEYLKTNAKENIEKN